MERVHGEVEKTARDGQQENLSIKEGGEGCADSSQHDYKKYSSGHEVGNPQRKRRREFAQLYSADGRGQRKQTRSRILLPVERKKTALGRHHHETK